MKSVFLDHASTTPVAVEVIEAMMPYFREIYGNPSSPHGPGRLAREAVEQSRESVANLLGCSPEEVYFTSGGSESDNLAIFGTASAQASKGRHIITSTVEHHAVLRCYESLERRGWSVTYVPVDVAGLVDPEDVRRSIREDTVLVSIMHANNEIGSIQPLAEIGGICREAGVLFHTDAVQTAGHIPTKVDDLGVSMLSLSGHKFHGPKGVGALYIRRGVHVVPQILGGGHERGRRSGTENVSGIVGIGRASELALADMQTESSRQARLRDKLVKGILDRVDDSILTGHPTKRSPNSASVVLGYIDGGAVLAELSAMGIAASSGSACTSGSLEPSHVLLAIGMTPIVAFGSLRFTLGRDTTDEDIDYVLEQLPEAVKKVRANAQPGDAFVCDCASGEVCCSP